MLNKISTRIRLYKGVRIGEIQAATEGNMTDWHWIRGEENCADWITRGLTPSQIGPDSRWWKGTEFLYRPVQEWNVKTSKELGQIENQLPGEKKIVQTHYADKTENFEIEFERFGSARKILWVYARILSIKREKSFKGGVTRLVTVKDILDSRQLLIKKTQQTMTNDFKSSSKSRYKNLNPTKNGEGIWIVGSRMTAHNPMSHMSDDPAILMPNNHPYTKLLMKQAHRTSGHRGRDATLARFRTQFWTPQGSKVAKSIVTSCQLCKLQTPRLENQNMGQLPIERLKPATPFSNLMLDLFGPYMVRGEIQKRTSGKTYGVIFTDLSSRAVHIKECFGYDTFSFMMTLRRFTSIRGWPATIFSDPGSQLVHTEKELRKVWKEVDKETQYKASTDNVPQWVFRLADSPWRQGSVEALVQSAERCLKFANDAHRITQSEFMTVCYETANILNECLLGRIPGDDDSVINILISNGLLLGKSTSSVLDRSRKTQ